MIQHIPLFDPFKLTVIPDTTAKKPSVVPVTRPIFFPFDQSEATVVVDTNDPTRFLYLLIRSN
jgi:hypothetical protein